MKSNQTTVTSHHRFCVPSPRWATAAVFLLSAAVAPRFAEPGALRLKSGTVHTGVEIEAGNEGHGAKPGSAAPSPLAVRLGLPPTAGSCWLVQSRGPIDAAFREGLLAAGARILGYVPDDAYLVRVAADALPDLARIAGAVVPYRPVDRLDPALARLLERAHRHPDPAILRVLGFRGEPAEPLAARAQQAAPGVVLRSLHVTGTGRSELVLDAPSRSLEVLLVALATDPGVEFVSPVGPLLALNDDASWILQTGRDPLTMAPGTRRFFEPLAGIGLTGVGQRVALADTGVDNDACQFRFAGGGQTIASATQPPAANVTNPGDKIVAYYVLNGADAYDSALVDYHGTRVAGAMVGDNSTAAQVPRTAPFTFAAWDTGDGMAPGATLVVQDIGDSLGFPIAGFNQEAVLLQAYASGARVHNSSYGEPPLDSGGGYLNAYGGPSALVDETLWRIRDLTSVWASGNWGEVDPATCIPGPCQPWAGASSVFGLGAVAKNTITVGATGNPGQAAETEEALVPESSRGPTWEGLIKPDVTAPGHDMTAIDDGSAASCATDRDLDSGSSYAAGAISGMAALARQYFTDGYYSPIGNPAGQRTRMDPLNEPEVFDPSNALVKAVLVNSARSMTGANTGDLNTTPCPPLTPGCSAPSFGQGWGRVTLDDTLDFGGAGERELRVLHDIWNGSTAFENIGRGDDPQPKAAILHRETHNYAFLLAPGTAGPLRCTLAWSDPPPSPAAALPLVNDLDLEVHDPGPDGVPGAGGDDIVFHGNQFLDARPFSDPAGLGRDSTNAIENVWMEVPHPGVHNLRVYGRTVPGNGIADAAAEPRTGPVASRIDSAQQGYALICSGDPMTILSPPFVSVDMTPMPAVACVEAMPSFDFTETSCATCVVYDWDFGDGSTATGSARAVSHTYTTAGLFLATVTGRTLEGVEARLSFPVEVIVGDRRNPPGRVGNSLRLVKFQVDSVIATWTDLPVPEATSYNLYEFDEGSKAAVSNPSPVPPGTLRNVPPMPIHGASGFLWNLLVSPPPTQAWARFLQVRAANCIGEPGP